MLYFPLKERLKKLFASPKYWQMCQHEYARPRNANLMTDIYDAPAWKEFMGPVSHPNTRIGLIYCIDAFPVNAEGSKSMKPGGYMNASLPPTERGKAQNMLLQIVIPTELKEDQQKKYYDFMAQFELNELFHRGVSGVRVKIFCTSMDTPGRAELMGDVRAIINYCAIYSVGCLFHYIFFLYFFIVYISTCRDSKLHGVPIVSSVFTQLDSWCHT